MKNQNIYAKKEKDKLIKNIKHYQIINIFIHLKSPVILITPFLAR